MPCRGKESNESDCLHPTAEKRRFHIFCLLFLLAYSLIFLFLFLFRILFYPSVASFLSLFLLIQFCQTHWCSWSCKHFNPEDIPFSDWTGYFCTARITCKQEFARKWLWPIWRYHPKFQVLWAIGKCEAGFWKGFSFYRTVVHLKLQEINA